MWNRRPAVVLLTLAVVVITSPAFAAPTAPARPNIVLILADDLGYSDLGCYGGEVRTPNLDALAKGGVRFTQFYNGGRCCPTRASLMTGLHPHQAGVGRMTNDAKLPGYRGRLNPETPTVAEVLRAAGYRTAMVGKWHLSNTDEGRDHMKYLNNQAILPQFGDPKTYPVGRGFEEHYGVIWGVVNFFDPFSLVHNAEPVREVPKDYYITDAISEHAVQYIEKYGSGEEPFFLYVAHTAPHWPLHALEEDIKRYEDTYKAGWDEVRAARHGRMKEMGVLPPGAETLGPRHQPERTWAENPNKEWDARAMAVHAAMIDRMDQGVGRIVEKLRAMNELDNTLILFMSDNGASPEFLSNSGFDRPSETRDGRRIDYLQDKKTMPGPETTFGAIGPIWASVANTPMRFWKAEMYEGGVCTPMIAHWPAGVTAPAGSVTHQVGHVIDVMGTCVDLAGTKGPATEGSSLAPIFRGETRPQPVLGWEHIGTRAYREGDWKVVSRRDGKWVLYDLSKDRAEMKDLSASEPDRVASMQQAWQGWAERVKVFPAPK